VLADRGFPFWPQVETVDLSLIDDIPTVSQVFRAIRENWTVGRVWMAEEFLACNSAEGILSLTHGIPITWETHAAFKLRVPSAIGLVRTGDTTQYANMILESA
jgi:D-ribose pyranase